MNNSVQYKIRPFFDFMKQVLNNLRFFTFLLIWTMTTACSSGAYLSDHEMEENLNSHRAEFNCLIEMFKQDSHLLSVDREFAYVSYDTKITLPSQRMDRYRKLFSKLGLIEARRIIGAKDISLKAWHKTGFMMGSTSKYYVYSETTPSLLIDSLDNLNQSGGHDVFAYKRVTDNWYLNLDNW